MLIVDFECVSRVTDVNKFVEDVRGLEQNPEGRVDRPVRAGKSNLGRGSLFGWWRRARLGHFQQTC